jgi:signal transduction histidine kinase
MTRPRLHLGTQDLVLLAVALVSIAVTGAQLASNWKSEDDARRQASLRQTEYETAEDLEDLLIQAENGQRGYLLFGTKVDLEQFYAAERDLPTLLGKLEQLRSPDTDPDVLLRLAQISRLKMDELARGIKEYDQDSSDPTKLTGSDQGLMEEAVRDANQIQTALVRRIGEHTIELEQYHKRALLISLVGGSFSFVVLCLSMIRLNRSFGKASELIEQVREGEHSYQLLADHVEVVREEERSEMARRIHDEVGQALTAAKLDLSLVQRKLGADPDAREKLNAADETLSSAIEIVRGISMELRPAILDALGLFPAVEWQAGEFAKRTGMEFRCLFSPRPRRYETEIEVSLFRIVQEALTNVVRHAHANKVEIRSDEKDGLRLTVLDNGVGISKDSVVDYRSMGLLGMKERARSIGGQLSVRAAQSGGTLVEVFVPRTGIKFDAA